MNSVLTVTPTRILANSYQETISMDSTQAVSNANSGENSTADANMANINTTASSYQFTGTGGTNQQQQQQILQQIQPSVTLTIRLIMQGKEVGSIIGKKGDNIKRFREESGAKITISDGSCPERIVTVTGSTEAILKAFAMIARKFEEDANNNLVISSTTNNNTITNLNNNTNSTNGKSSTTSSSSGSSTASSNSGPGQQTLPVTLKLIVPASQCGSLIGKGGSKIKEIREVTGASIQVASEMLPNSTERAVTLSGTAESITKSIYQICCVMLESPPKGPTIPYRPKPAMPPVFFAGGQAYTIQGQFAIPHPDLTKLHRLALQHAPLLPGQAVGSLNPQATLATLAANTAAATMGAASTHPLVHHPSAAASSASHASHAAVAAAAAAATGMVATTLTTEMTISNDIIGSVIGKGGSKINEIRQLSGATIKINSSEEGTKDRTITISGTPEAINLAQYLIATSSNGLLNSLASHPTGATPTASNTVATTGVATANTSLNTHHHHHHKLAFGTASGSSGSNSKHGLSNAAAVLAAASISNGGSLTTVATSAVKSKNDRKYAPY